MNDYIDFYIISFFNPESISFYLNIFILIFVIFLRYLCGIFFSSWPILFSNNHSSISYLRHKGSKHEARGVSIILASHNTDREIIQTVLSLLEQTIKKIQIIVVNDGSSDFSETFAKDLLRKKLIDNYVHLNIRGGKAAALNAGFEFAKYYYTMFCDTGTTFHKDAIEIALGYFDDPKVGALSCSVGVRNGEQNLLTYFQKMHYFVSCLSLRNMLNFMGLQFVIAGAFGLFRTDALKAVGIHTPGTGEDLDLTMRFRRLGWKAEFSYFSMALTDAPETIKSFVKQTFRWDRDGIRIICQMYAPHVINPFSKYFDMKMAIAAIDNIFVSCVLIVFIYFTILLVSPRDIDYLVLFVFIVCLITTAVEFFIFLFTLLLVNKFDRDWRYLYYVPFYVIFKIFFYEPLRFIAIWSEVIFKRSYKDNFSPHKVQRVLKEEEGGS